MSFHIVGPDHDPEGRIFIPPNTCQPAALKQSTIAGGEPLSAPEERRELPPTRQGRRAHYGKRSDSTPLQMPEGAPPSYGNIGEQQTAKDDASLKLGTYSASSPFPAAEELVDHVRIKSDVRRINLGSRRLAIPPRVLAQVLDTLAYRDDESAGVLFGPAETNLATVFIEDKKGERTAASFTLDVAYLNSQIRPMRELGLTIVAVVHSHPSGFLAPSAGDVRYVGDLFAHPKNGSVDHIFMPIVVDGHLLPYVLYRDDPGYVHPARLVVID